MDCQPSIDCQPTVFKEKGVERTAGGSEARHHGSKQLPVDGKALTTASGVVVDAIPRACRMPTTEMNLIPDSLENGADQTGPALLDDQSTAAEWLPASDMLVTGSPAASSSNAKTQVEDQEVPARGGLFVARHGQRKTQVEDQEVPARVGPPAVPYVPSHGQRKSANELNPVIAGPATDGSQTGQKVAMRSVKVKVCGVRINFESERLRPFLNAVVGSGTVDKIKPTYYPGWNIIKIQMSSIAAAREVASLREVQLYAKGERRPYRGKIETCEPAIHKKKNGIYWAEEKDAEDEATKVRILRRNEIPGRLIFIGDVHGTRHTTEQLLEELKYNPAVDFIVFLGDMIGKGNEEAAVMDLVMELHRKSNGRCVCLMGNHDWYAVKGARKTPEAFYHTHRSSTYRTLTAAHIDFIEQCPTIVTIPDSGLIAVHAGLRPGVELAKQRFHDLIEMRGWTADWDAHQDTLPVHERRKVIFGHDAEHGASEHSKTAYTHCVDTGCVNGGKLTAVVYPSGGGRDPSVFSVPRAREDQ